MVGEDCFLGRVNFESALEWNAREFTILETKRARGRAKGRIIRAGAYSERREKQKE